MNGLFVLGATQYLSFPGLGLERWFHIDRLIPLFGGKMHIAWYGIFVTAGMIAAFFYALWRAKKIGVSTDDMLDVALFTILFGVLGARLYYVAFDWKAFSVAGATFAESAVGTLKNIVAIWNGGLAIPGGLIAGIVTISVVCRIKKIRLPALLDCIAPGVMIGQAIGRWGNFFNVEAYGSETTLPWRMGIANVSSESVVSAVYVHPTFLYEMLWSLLGFALINFVLYRRKKFHGQIILSYLVWYSLGRMLIEQLRTDSLMIGSVRVTQVLCAAVALVGIVLIVLALVKKPKSLWVTAEAEAVPADGAPVEKADVDESVPAEAPAAEETPTLDAIGEKTADEAVSEAEEDSHGQAD